ncbi:MAG TPA: UDP-glucose/GDP-mannose dehydrogenase family protein [Actinophytocola sp.]|jgi:UDPglucose 6-dehydrogenase|uniref:UDP-glucose dehydrogenase family protein n=1 Tax=Actinophytocola sp. TaxID=1872138 RepID=UPI002F959721
MADGPIGVVGAGYVGLTTAACLAHLDHRVRCVDVDPARVAAVNRGEVPIAEPDLAGLVHRGLVTGRLSFATDAESLGGAQVVLLCVPTPMGDGGVPDLGALRAALGSLARVLPAGAVLAVKSTVPVGTTADIPAMLGRDDVGVVSNPEFLREGHAVRDFLHPDRIVVGSADPAAAERVVALYRGIPAPVVRTDPASAELGKYASNAFLAMKLSYVNLLAELCEQVGADIRQVARAMSLDERIGGAFTAPGPGWGGSCLPKDTAALVASARRSGVDPALLTAVIDANTRAQDHVVAKVRSAVSPSGSLAGVRLGLLGLTFKAGTDDLRHSPALAVATRLAAAGAQLTAYDPAVRTPVGPVQVVEDPYLVAKDAAGVVLLTEWPEFRELDWGQLMSVADRPVVVDTRNVLDHARLAAQGITCLGLGVPS